MLWPSFQLRKNGKVWDEVKYCSKRCQLKKVLGELCIYPNPDFFKHIAINNTFLMLFNILKNITLVY